jgi:hypothetical protein
VQELDRSGWCAHSACRTQASLIVLTLIHVRTPQGRRLTIIIDFQRSRSPRLAVWAASPCTVPARASAAMDSSPYWASDSGNRVLMAHEPMVCFEVLRNRVRALRQPRFVLAIRRPCAGYTGGETQECCGGRCAHRHAAHGAGWSPLHLPLTPKCSDGADAVMNAA